MYVYQILNIFPTCMLLSGTVTYLSVGQFCFELDQNSIFVNYVYYVYLLLSPNFPAQPVRLLGLVHLNIVFAKFSRLKV